MHSPTFACNNSTISTSLSPQLTPQEKWTKFQFHNSTKENEYQSSYGNHHIKHQQFIHNNMELNSTISYTTMEHQFGKVCL